MEKKKTFRDYCYSSLSEYRDIFPAIPHICGYENNFCSDIMYDVRGREKGSLHRVMFQYTFSGGGLLEMNGNSLSVSPGKAILLEIPGDFRYRIDPVERHWESFFTSFSDTFSIRLVHDLMEVYGNVVELSGDSATVKNAHGIYEVMKGSQAMNPYAVSRAGYDFLMSLVMDLESGRAETGGRKHFLQSRAAAYCMTNLDRKISVMELAEYCGYTRSHFCRIFQETAGISPSEFILNFKLGMAEKILLYEHATVKETAARCGFDDYSYFCRAFKRVYGITASRFASSGGEHDSPPSHRFHSIRMGTFS